jgi:hypothetical protein
MVTRRPVVQQDKAEDVLFRIFDVEPLSPWDRFGEKVAHLELEIQFLRRAVGGLRVDSVGEVDVRGSGDGAWGGQDGGDAGVVD